MEKPGQKLSKVDCMVCETKVSTIETLKSSDSDMVRTFAQISGLSQDNCEEWTFCTMCFYELKIITNFRKRCAQSNIILLKKAEEDPSVNDESEIYILEEEYLDQPLPQSKFEKELSGQVSVKEVEIKDNSCPICHKEFSFKNSIPEHIRTIHKNIRDFVCEICGNAFHTQRALKIHSLIHSGEKPFKCHYCGQCFRQYGGLKNHIKIHLDSKNYSCQHCNKKFRLKNHLMEHVERIHEKIRNFKCDLCPDRAFYSKKGLDYHKKVHLGLRDKSCQHCDRSFYNNSDLRVHIRKFHASTIQSKANTTAAAVSEQEPDKL